MDSVKISELESVTELLADDTFPVIDNGTTKKATITQISDFVGGSSVGDKPMREYTATFQFSYNNSSVWYSADSAAGKEIKAALERAIADGPGKFKLVFVNTASSPTVLETYMSVSTSGKLSQYTSGHSITVFETSTRYAGKLMLSEWVGTVVDGSVVGDSSGYIWRIISQTCQYATTEYVDGVVESAGGASAPTVVTDAATAYTITTLNGNYVYDFTADAMLTLTIGAVSTFKDYETTIFFNSGETPTNIIVPSTGVIHIGDDAPVFDNGIGTVVANTKYIISVLNNRMVWRGYTE